LTELLHTLDDEPDTPSTVDIRRAIASAKRTRRFRRALAGGGAAVVTAAASVAGFILIDPAERPAPISAATGAPAAPAKASDVPEPAITSCTLSRLPVPGKEPMALVTGADPTGEWIVGRTYPKSGGYQAVIWHDGEVEKVMLPGDLEESLRDVNRNGVAVGWSYDESGPVPYAYADGKITKLAETGSAQAVNDAGRIVGGIGELGRERGVVWERIGAAPVELPAPDGATSVQARDVDADGTVVGSLDLEIPYYWAPDGTHGRLPMPEIDGRPAAVAQAFHVRNGWATGMAAAASLKGPKGADGAAGDRERTYAARWNLRTGEVEITGGLRYPADEVNAYGWQVGTDAEGYAVLVTNAGPVRLPDLGKHREDGTATIANSVSDDGRIIAGQSDDRTGTIQAVLWRCE
jgi:uncharacterized membrane protein